MARLPLVAPAARRRSSSACSIATVVGLVGALLVGFGPTVGSASANEVVVARHADLTERDRTGSGAGVGAQRLASASVRADTQGDRVQATVVLDDEPSAATSATLVVAFGPVDDGACVLDDFLDGNQYATSTTDLAPGWTRSGRTLTLDLAAEEAGYQPWECAGALIGVGNQVVSFLGGSLVDEHLRPQLQVQPVKVLDRRVRGKLGLVRGESHLVRVPVRSLNRAAAERVMVRGSGRGLRVTRAALGTVSAESTREAVLTVRATARRAGPLRLTVTSANGAPVRRVVPVRLVRPPAAPRPGSYRSADGDVRFRITGGRAPRVTGFRVDTQTRCQPPLEFATYTRNTYSFPKVRVAGGGVVDARQVKQLFSVSLQLRVAGGRATQGRFSYVGPRRSYCSAIETFTARRTGR